MFLIKVLRSIIPSIVLTGRKILQVNAACCANGSFIINLFCLQMETFCVEWDWIKVQLIPVTELIENSPLNGDAFELKVFSSYKLVKWVVCVYVCQTNKYSTWLVAICAKTALRSEWNENNLSVPSGINNKEADNNAGTVETYITGLCRTKLLPVQ